MQPSQQLPSHPMVSKIVFVHCLVLEKQNEVRFHHLPSQFDLVLRCQRWQIAYLPR